MSAASTSAPDERIVNFRTQGAVSELWDCTDPEVVISGPAGTGKTRGTLELLHYRLASTPDVRALILRKTLASLKGTALVTFDEQVHPEWDGVTFMGDTKKRPPQYIYPNGSTLTVGGLDNPTKVMSSEYDLICVSECTELDLRDWESLVTRTNRPGRPKPLGFTQVIGDCNPDAPTHWIRARAEANQLTLLISTHEDNPSIFDVDIQEYTVDGVSYITTLDRLTGVRYLRLRKGLWAAAEGVVYEDAWNAAKNIVDRKTISSRPGDLFGDCGVPRDWPRYMAVDFGFTHPFVCRWYAEDGDGRLWMYREIYMTHKLVEDHAAEILRYARWGASPNGDLLPRAIICDHDAEGRATLERHLGLRTTKADKRVIEGIQIVATRMRPAGDGLPRILYLRDSTVQRDPYLLDLKAPSSGIEEPESYVWELRGNGKRGEAPVKENDHACDCDRYMCVYRDMRARVAKYGGHL